MRYKLKPMVLEEWERGLLVHFFMVNPSHLPPGIDSQKSHEFYTRVCKQLQIMHEPKDCPMAKHLHSDNVGTPLCGLCEGSRD